VQAIKIENVSYAYRQLDSKPIIALNGINLEICQGEFVVMCGSNGSGKSTLAKLLNGLLIPTKGEVYAFGINTRDKTKIFDIRARVGMVFQNPDNQMIASIVEDDIAFGPENLGIPREEIIERVAWALEAVGMSDHRHSTPFKMSGGQKQRIAIAAVLAMLPSVLVLDESTAMLDPKGRREVMSVIHRLNKEENITVIHITHHMEEAIGADRLIVLNKGMIVMDDTPENIFQDEVNLRAYSLDIPIIQSIQMELLNKGIDVQGYITNEKELSDRICRLM